MTIVVVVIIVEFQVWAPKCHRVTLITCTLFLLNMNWFAYFVCICNVSMIMYGKEERKEGFTCAMLLKGSRGDNFFDEVSFIINI